MVTLGALLKYRSGVKLGSATLDTKHIREGAEDFGGVRIARVKDGKNDLVFIGAATVYREHPSGFVDELEVH